MEFFIFNLLFKYIEMPLKFLIQDKDNKGPLVCLPISAIKDIWNAPASEVMFKKN